MSAQPLASAVALHTSATYVPLISVKSVTTKRGASVLALLVVLVAWSTLRHLLATLAGLLLLLPVYSYKVKGSGNGKLKARPRLEDSALQAPTRQQLIAAFTARARAGGSGGALLPPPTPPLRNRLTVVLDLDETLVVAFRPSSVSPSARRSWDAPAVPTGRRGAGLELECTTTLGTTERVIFYQRPGLADFLQRLASFAEVVVFTAGLPSYAEPLVRAIDPAGNLFSAVLCRGATLATRSRDYVKDLDVLGRDLRRVVLVDNNPFSFLLQPLNGIPVAPYCGDPDDAQLLDVLLPLLYGLAHLPDVRPVLASKFAMPQWFASRGYDVPTLVM